MKCSKCGKVIGESCYSMVEIYHKRKSILYPLCCECDKEWDDYFGKLIHKYEKMFLRGDLTRKEYDRIFDDVWNKQFFKFLKKPKNIRFVFT